MFCKYCGSKIDDDSIFCAFCGKKLIADTIPAQKERVDENTEKLNNADDEPGNYKDITSVTELLCKCHGRMDEFELYSNILAEYRMKKSGFIVRYHNYFQVAYTVNLGDHLMGEYREDTPIEELFHLGDISVSFIREGVEEKINYLSHVLAFCVCEEGVYYAKNNEVFFRNLHDEEISIGKCEKISNLFCDEKYLYVTYVTGIKDLGTVEREIMMGDYGWVEHNYNVEQQIAVLDRFTGRIVAFSGKNDGEIIVSKKGNIIYNGMQGGAYNISVIGDKANIKREDFQDKAHDIIKIFHSCKQPSCILWYDKNEFLILNKDGECISFPTDKSSEFDLNVQRGITKE